MNKKKLFLRVRSSLCLLLLPLLLQGCLQSVGTPNDTSEPSSDPVSSPTYLYQDMTFSYRTDVSAVLADITTGMSPAYLVLVNKQTPVTAASDLSSPTYALEDAVKLTRRAAKDNMELEARTARALYAMLDEMAADGITDIQIQSAYRSESYQQNTFNHYWSEEQKTISAEARAFFGEDYITAVYTSNGLTKLSSEDAKKVANYYSAFPGQSEHHTGLCVDFSTASVGLTDAFAYTAAGQWLLQNCHRFGFILRYPENKTDITGYCYEPWHYRFVGREAATEIMLRGITLEEFLG